MDLDLNGLERLAWVQVWQVTVVAILIGAVARFCCRQRPSARLRALDGSCRQVDRAAGQE